MKQITLDSVVEGTYKIINGIIHVTGNVDISDLGLDVISWKFGKVTGNFDCSHNELTTLENCLETVGFDFFAFKIN